MNEAGPSRNAGPSRDPTPSEADRDDGPPASEEDDEDEDGPLLAEGDDFKYVLIEKGKRWGGPPS